MSERIPHYRQKCVADFALAEPGSINLQQYAESFRQAQEIERLRKKLKIALEQGFSFSSAEDVALISRSLDHEISRALFPFRYVRYGTSIFGSARLDKKDPEFREVTKITCGIVSESLVDIYTGGGPGIMEAANQGLKDGAKIREGCKKRSRAKNTGLSITLPFEESANAHLDIHAPHLTFGTRLNEFADRSNSTVTWDGGGGSDLERAFLFQLKQVGHLEADFPLILKRQMWEAIQEQKMRTMYFQRVANDRTPLVSPKDGELVMFADHPDDAIQYILNHYNEWKTRVWNKLDTESQEAILES